MDDANETVPEQAAPDPNAPEGGRNPVYGYFQHLSSTSRRRLSDLYEAPALPFTPSPTINSMLHTYCSGPDEYLWKAVCKHGVCSIFTTIDYVYDALHDDSQHPNLPMWTLSCLIACLIVIAFIYILYTLACFSGLLFHKVLLYSAVVASIVAVVVVFVAILFFEEYDA
ncbi:hypothetical protein LSAT2_006081 [Lamellibrachia satsuma]|nr:hypothetical protein LSAT2_006081 [Lamellibrachia satsuma]